MESATVYCESTQETQNRVGIFREQKQTSYQPGSDSGVVRVVLGVPSWFGAGRRFQFSRKRNCAIHKTSDGRQLFRRATQIILNGRMRLLLMEFADPHQVVQRCFVVVAQLVPS